MGLRFSKVVSESVDSTTHQGRGSRCGWGGLLEFVRKLPGLGVELGGRVERESASADVRPIPDFNSHGSELCEVTGESDSNLGDSKIRKEVHDLFGDSLGSVPKQDSSDEVGHGDHDVLPSTFAVVVALSVEAENSGVANGTKKVLDDPSTSFTVSTGGWFETEVVEVLAVVGSEVSVIKSAKKSSDRCI
jgi:hypothetical protein